MCRCVRLTGLFDRDELRSVFNAKTRAIITASEQSTARFSHAKNGIYRRSARSSTPFASLTNLRAHNLSRAVRDSTHLDGPGPGCENRTVIVNFHVEDLSVTGWRVGYSIAPPEITSGIRKVHDFSPSALLRRCSCRSLCAATPPEYYDKLQRTIGAARFLVPALEALDFAPSIRGRRYYIMTDISGFGFATTLSLQNTDPGGWRRLRARSSFYRR